MYLPSWGGGESLGSVLWKSRCPGPNGVKNRPMPCMAPALWGDWEIGPSGFPLPFPIRTPPIPGPTERTATPRPMDSSEEQLDQMAPAMLRPFPNSDLTR